MAGHVTWNRRNVLSIGIGLAGHSTASLLWAAGKKKAASSAILIWLSGGPSHLDSFDPKPMAAAEVRGETTSIATSVPGIRIAGGLPQLARQVRHTAILRSVHHRQGAHEPGSAYMISGYKFRPGHNYASLGSVVGYELRQRSRQNGLPAYFGIPGESVRGGGHLGTAYNPLSIPGDANDDKFRVKDLRYPAGVSAAQFQLRRRLRAQLSAEFRGSRSSKIGRAVEKYVEQAYRLTSSRKAQRALELGREADKVRSSYGRNTFGQRLLLARRLIEAGVPFVTVADSGWDHHRGIFQAMPPKRAALDQAVAALLADLHARNRLQDTLVIMMGEFGRTPKMNDNAGRDHWPHTFSVMLAGGGVKGGRVIGASDKRGAYPQERPVTPEQLFHSIYTLIGIDPHKFLPATSGRDVQVVRGGSFIDELTR